MDQGECAELCHAFVLVFISTEVHDQVYHAFLDNFIKQGPMVRHEGQSKDGVGANGAWILHASYLSNEGKKVELYDVVEEILVM